MADDVFYMKTGDTAPALRYLLLPRTVDLTGAGYIVFNMMDRNGNVVLSRRPGVVITAKETPTVEYRWTSGETDLAAGRYRGEFEIQFADGKRASFPNDGYIDIVFDDDIA